MIEQADPLAVESGGLCEVQIASLVQHKAFQVRERLDDGTINRYAAGFRYGGEITRQPILVGRIQAPPRQPRGRPPKHLVGVEVGALVLLAGFHRVAACRLIGQPTILARVVDTTAREAQWLAAESNLAHGLPLKNKEVRRAFEAFVRAGQYLNADGSRKSLRVIGQLFGKDHKTIHAWLNTPDLRWLFKQYGPEQPKQNLGPPPATPQPSPQEQAFMTLMEAAQQMKNGAPMLAVEQLMELVIALREATGHLESAIARQGGTEGEAG